MDYKRVIVIYKSHEYESIKESKLKGRHMDKKKVLMILVPLYGKENIYMIIKPNSLFLAKRFVAHLSNQAISLAYDEQEIYYLASLEDIIDTTSLIEFCNFMSVIYKENGVANLMESTLENPDTYEIFYPEAYQITFYDQENHMIDQLERTSQGRSGIWHIDDFCEFYEDIFTDRMEPIQDLFLTMDLHVNNDWLMNIRTTGNSFVISSNGTWRDIKKNDYKNRRLSQDELCLDYIHGFGCFFVCGASLPRKVFSHLPIDMKIFIINNEDLRKYLAQYHVDLDFMYQLIEKHDLGFYNWNANTFIGDYNTYITWVTFIDEIIGYTLALQKILSHIYGTEEECEDNLVAIIQSSTLKRIFSVTNTVNTKIQNALLTFLNERI